MFYRYYDQTEGRVSDMGPCFYSHWSIPVFLWAKLKLPVDSGPSPWGALETQDESDIWWWWQSSPKNSNSSAVKVEVRGTFTAVTEWVLTEKHWLTSFNDVILLPFVRLQISNLKKNRHETVFLVYSCLQFLSDSKTICHVHTHSAALLWGHYITSIKVVRLSHENNKTWQQFDIKVLNSPHCYNNEQHWLLLM